MFIKTQKGKGTFGIHVGSAPQRDGPPPMVIINNFK